MKTIAAPVEMVCWFDLNGRPYPVRFRHKGSVVKVQQVIHTTEEKLAGNLMKVFRCQSEVDGVMRVFELKYELQTCKWFLWKM
ncbi:hypothetical protein M8H41_18595 [Desulfosporosinus nitroreducens]|uniref:Uncharacterized protein n=1 Tax=Desulfosporosinus nitroreducens TaxID=2018668 RepID=A0ABT8QU10_9FIRM|nr:hypothetical protein [Desulfosporosinus nitroreducens]MCO1604659.1 hypothetical protein [Desulfosporosinus nitroreducens]MDO0824847.1 hypothetical protein [Desulfosporosinus nitroreducens]